MQDIVYVAIVKECGGFAVSPLTSILYITSFFIPVIEMVNRLQAGSGRAFSGEGTMHESKHAWSVHSQGWTRGAS